MPKYIHLPRLDQNDPQIREYTEAVQRGEKSFHIFTHNEGWIVKRIKDSKAQIFSNKAEAYEHARNKAAAAKTEVILHGKDGRIEARKSYEE